ncbi:MAG: TonB-dependent receptor [Gemmatimonadales bacterium]
MTWRTFRRAFSTLVLGLVVGVPAALTAQATGSVTGRVVRGGEGSPLSGIQVMVAGTAITATTGIDGRYTLARVPAGRQMIQFRQLGFRPLDSEVNVTAGAAVTLDVGLVAAAIQLGDIMVEGASRAPERIVEAPAAVSVISRQEARDIASTGQIPLVLNNTPGVDVVPSGMNDFNVNARGFNSSLNRRILVLQDGRDLSIAFLGSQEWSAMTLPADQFGRIEMVRGPGSALYGANAFSGVLNFTTPAAREVVGTTITLAGGALATLRGDLHHAGVLNQGRIGYRINGGYNQSDSWSRTRTNVDGTSLQGEYAGTTDSAVGVEFEVIPLRGQTVDAATGALTGEPDPIRNMYGSARLDYYLTNGAIMTVDGGAARVQNDVFVTGIGRVQVPEALRPWARVAWAHPRYNLTAWYSGRKSVEPQVSLRAGLPLDERSSIMHIEGQFNQGFMDEQLRLVMGASARNSRVNTNGTLMNLANDDRSDNLMAAYGQLDFRPTDQLRLVVAGRVDDGSLFATQFSPKGAIVFSPSNDHSFRFTVNRAFQTPNYSEFYLQAPAGAPTGGPAQLEAGLEQYFAGVQGAIDGGLLPGAIITGLDISPVAWNFSAQTPILALGNANLDVEKVTGLEFGYKGTLSGRAFLTFDVYLSRLSDFVTDLLPGVNPAFPTYALTDGDRDIPATLQALDQRFADAGLPANHPLRVNIPTLLAGYAQLASQAGPALVTMPDGTRAIAVSYTNAGRVTERGVEVGLSYGLTEELSLSGTYALFDFEVDASQTAAGDQLLPNTPKHRMTGALSYQGVSGFDMTVSARIVTGFRWAAGVFQGYVPASQTVNASMGYAVSSNFRLHVTGTNILDQQRFHLYGGSVIGRRVLGGITASF